MGLSGICEAVIMPIKDKEKNRKYQREWARKNGKTKKRNQVGFRTRQKMVDDAKSHPCVVCNKEYPIEVMELHHIDAASKTSTISQLQRTASYAKLRDEVDKCAPVCANCDRLLKHGYVDLPELILLPS